MGENHDIILRQKTARLESARVKIQQFVDNGGDLQSSDAVPLGLELIEAFSDLAKELHEGEKTDVASANVAASQTMEQLLRLFEFRKKRDLEKYCRDVVIHQEDFVNFILACESGMLPFQHLIHYGDHVPEGTELTDGDLAALAANGVGPLKPDAQRTVRKIGHLFKVRRYLVGHIFFVPDLSEWHFFQFDQRDLDDENPNHWKEGAHVHFVNWLWPNHDARTLWENFTSGKVKMNDSLHVRFTAD